MPIVLFAAKGPGCERGETLEAKSGWGVCGISLLVAFVILLDTKSGEWARGGVRRRKGAGTTGDRIGINGRNNNNRSMSSSSISDSSNSISDDSEGGQARRDRESDWQKTETGAERQSKHTCYCLALVSKMFT